MDFLKSEIDNYTWKVKNTAQFTIDDTINVPDNLLDIERLVLVKGNVVIEEIQAMVDRFQVKGCLNYQILYCADKESNTFDSITGKVPFIEYMNADGTKETDYIEVHAGLNDITVAVLHSRKLSLKALIGLDYQVKEKETFEAISSVADENAAEVLSGTISMMKLKLRESKRVEICEQAEIPANKPDIYQVIWKNMTLINPRVKAEDGYLLASGTLSVFLVYNAEEDDMPIQYFSLDVPFEKRIDEPSSDADMIPAIILNLDQYHIAITQNDKGQDRMIDLTAELTMEVKLYGEEEVTLVKDAYSTEEEINPKWRQFTLWHLLMRNCAKLRISENIDMPKNQTILQICYTEGSVLIEETSRTPKGILVEGVVSAQVTYLNKADNGALSSSTFDIPFSSEIELNATDDEITYMIAPYIDQISAVQLADDKLEIKAEVSLDVIAFVNESSKAVLDMEIKPIDYEKKKELPGITCYIVKEGDTLWSIAKRFYTTVERIKETNSLESDLIHVGDKLVILKE
ncbi:MAG: DUF3794 domain-containing protein [Lachnospiraceae bacterium]|nr:DUF3794 domain-containing protein [Lachnospiraceae bacterium]